MATRRRTDKSTASSSSNHLQCPCLLACLSLTSSCSAGLECAAVCQHLLRHPPRLGIFPPSVNLFSFSPSLYLPHHPRLSCPSLSLADCVPGYLSQPFALHTCQSFSHTNGLEPQNIAFSSSSALLNLFSYVASHLCGTVRRPVLPVEGGISIQRCEDAADKCLRFRLFKQLLWLILSEFSLS